MRRRVDGQHGKQRELKRGARPVLAGVRDAEEATVEREISLNEQRLGSVVAALKAVDAHTVVDLGCGEGRLLQALRKERPFTRIVGALSHSGRT